MRKFLLLLVVLMVHMVALAAPMPYEVRQIAVEVQAAEDGGNTPALARQQAMDMATDQGLRQLLKLITPEDTWSKHDEMLQKTPPKNLLERFSIVQESSRMPYGLVVDLYFKRDKVRKMLADNGIPFIDTKQETVLVVPVYVVGENAQLFEEENAWGGAVQLALQGPHLAQFKLPNGDYDDMMTLTPEMALLGVAEPIQALGQKHKADMVLVSVAKVIFRGGQRVLQVQSTWYGSQSLQPISFEMEMSEAKQPHVMQKAAQKLIQGVDSQWRSSNTVAVNKPQSLVAFLNVAEVADLESALKTLNGLASVQQAFLRSLTKREAYIQVDYYGESADLAEVLRTSGYVLNNQEGRWLLSAGRGAAEFSPQAEAPVAVEMPQPQAQGLDQGSVE